MGRRISQEKRMSLAPSLIMAPMEDTTSERKSPIREFLNSHIKTIVTIFMIFGTIAVIVVIVMGEQNYFSIFVIFVISTFVFITFPGMDFANFLQLVSIITGIDREDFKVTGKFSNTHLGTIQVLCETCMPLCRYGTHIVSEKFNSKKTGIQRKHDVIWVIILLKGGAKKIHDVIRQNKFVHKIENSDLFIFLG